MSITSRFSRGLAGLAAALAIGVAVAGSAGAATTVTQQINGSTLTASITNASLTTVTYSNSPQTTTGTLALSVSDATGLSNGWNVQVSSTGFVYTSGGSQNAQTILATGFTIVTDNAPSFVAGQGIDATNGPKAVSTSNGLDLASSRKVITSAVGYGSGAYAQNIDVQLAVPATSQTGLYTATLTVAVTAAP